jgi:hypothetical protein
MEEHGVGLEMGIEQSVDPRRSSGRDVHSRSRKRLRSIGYVLTRQAYELGND